MGQHLTEIAVLLIGVALVALLVNPRARTTAVIGTGGQVFNELLRTVTLQSQGGMGMPMGGFSMGTY